ncbi:putative cell survival pathways protein [Lobulomyces angularis]|nr:putative cell survival pathways protein [Lobulomyces angularis]
MNSDFESTLLSDVAWTTKIVGGTESETIYLTLDNGAFAFVQVVYSTMSWSPSVQMTCRYYSSDGKIQSQMLNSSGANFIVSDDNSTVSCDGVKIQTVEEKFLDISFTSGANFIFNFKFVPLGDGKGVKFKNPSSCAAEDGASNIFSKFFSNATVEGMAVFNGKATELKGKAAQTKPQYVGQWNFVNFQSAKDSIILYQFNVPTDQEFKPTVNSLGMVYINEKLIAVTSSKNNKVSHTYLGYDDFSGYEIPKNLTYTLEGETEEKKKVSISMVCKTTRLLAKIDVLAELPYLLKKFIQTFVTAPYCYQWFEDSEVKILLGGEESVYKGKIFCETSFLGVVTDNIR